jgi:hypothetical protein
VLAKPSHIAKLVVAGMLVYAKTDAAVVLVQPVLLITIRNVPEALGDQYIISFPAVVVAFIVLVANTPPLAALAVVKIDICSSNEQLPPRFDLNVNA